MRKYDFFEQKKIELFTLGEKYNYQQFMCNLVPQGPSDSPKVTLLIWRKTVVGLKAFDPKPCILSISPGCILKWSMRDGPCLQSANDWVEEIRNITRKQWSNITRCYLFQ